MHIHTHARTHARTHTHTGAHHSLTSTKPTPMSQKSAIHMRLLKTVKSYLVWKANAVRPPTTVVVITAACSTDCSS